METGTTVAMGAPGNHLVRGIDDKTEFAICLVRCLRKISSGDDDDMLAFIGGESLNGGRGFVAGEHAFFLPTPRKDAVTAIQLSLDVVIAEHRLNIGDGNANISIHHLFEAYGGDARGQQDQRQ